MNPSNEDTESCPAIPSALNDRILYRICVYTNRRYWYIGTIIRKLHGLWLMTLCADDL